ncbi:MAG: hypothetical protein V1494_05720 [Candidatus Diapherotrites archaeon]
MNSPQRSKPNGAMDNGVSEKEVKKQENRAMEKHLSQKSVFQMVYMGILGAGKWILGLSVRHKPVVVGGIILAGIFAFFGQWLPALGILGLVFVWTQLS